MTWCGDFWLGVPLSAVGEVDSGRNPAPTVTIPFNFPETWDTEEYRRAGERAAQTVFHREALRRAGVRLSQTYKDVFGSFDPCTHFVAAEDKTEVDTGRNPAPPNPVRERLDGVIKDLGDRLPSQPDRVRLRKALDTADGPDTSRKEADKALGRVAARG